MSVVGGLHSQRRSGAVSTRTGFYAERLEARALLSTYVVTNLGAFGATDAYAISNNGQVTGAYGSGNTTQPYIYNYNSGAFTVPGLPAGEAYGWGSGINDSGQLAMFGADPNPAQLYSGGSWQVLPLHTPEFINGAGRIAGSVYSPSGIAHAILYDSDSGVSTDLLGPDNVNGATIYTAADARSVNSSGQACGVAVTPSGIEGFIYNAGAVTYLPNVDAYGINDVGAVTGHDYSSGQPYVYQNGVIHDLGASGYAFGINNGGEVVGVGDSGAFVYSNGAVQNLNSLIPSNSGWSLSVARAINNDGQIVGFGTYNGEQAAFLLTPMAVPTSLSAANVTATYGGMAALSATLTSAGQPISGETVSFSLGNTVLGSATTDQTGTATLEYSLGTLNALQYTIQTNFAGTSTQPPSSATFTLTVSPLDITSLGALTQSSLNVSKAGTISFALDLSNVGVFVNGVSTIDSQTVGNLFNGAQVTLSVNGTTYSAAINASVSGTTLTFGIRMSQDLQNALLSVMNQDGTFSSDVFSFSSISLSDNYVIDGDALTRLFQAGKLTFPIQ